MVWGTLPSLMLMRRSGPGRLCPVPAETTYHLPDAAWLIEAANFAIEALVGIVRA